MLSVVAGVALAAHGVVYGLYAGQSSRLFELQPGLAWPDGSWAFSRAFGVRATRRIATVCCLGAAAAFVTCGVALIVEYEWWRPVVVAAAAFSAAVFVLLWDGRARKLDAQGGIGVLIDAGIVVAVLVTR